MDNDYLESAIKQLKYYKFLGEKTIDQLTEDQLFWKYNQESNSIANIINHLRGNMLSRWTDFLTSDGEKPTRNRDEEFEDIIRNKQELMEKWHEGWTCLFTAIKALTKDDLGKIIYIRNQGHTVTEAINRQLAHYPYHIGQIVFIGKMALDHHWKSLSIPKGNSKAYNENKFSQSKQIGHFTDEFLKSDKEE